MVHFLNLLVLNSNYDFYDKELTPPNAEQEPWKKKFGPLLETTTALFRIQTPASEKPAGKLGTKRY